MLRRSLFTGTLLGTAMAVVAGPALAQKKDNTVRIAFFDPISMIDAVYDPKPETGFTTNAVYDRLMTYETAAGKFRPRIAESWTRVNPTTYEFRLKKGLKFHDGSDLDADDVVYTVNFVADPKVRFRIKSRFLFIKGAEKIDQHTVRITTKRPSASAMMRFARSISIYPSDVHGALAKKNTFGRNPVGSGPYRAAMVDPEKGIVLERVDNYQLAADYRPAGKVKRYVIKQIPSVQTQVAQLLTGNLDMMYRVPKDQVDNLRNNPNFGFTAQSKGLLIAYLLLDAAGRSENPALKDIRVRKAIMHAINRKAIQTTLIAGGSDVPQVESMCFRNQAGCDFSARLPEFDPAKAKLLLAEAGVSDLSLEITSVTSSPAAVPQAIAGYLRAVGIKATVTRLPFPPYRKKQAQGKIQALANPWASGGLPDVESTANFFFAPGARNYSRDPVITKLAKDGASTFDPKARKAIYKKLFDRVTEQAYIVPVATTPPVFVHAKDLHIGEVGSDETYGTLPNQIWWK